LVIPTAASDPATTVQGAFYFNTTQNRIRIYSGGQWRNV
jgi:hypothetical protein